MLQAVLQEITLKINKAMNNFSVYKAAWISVEDSAWCSIWSSVRGPIVLSAWNITKFSVVNWVEIYVIDSTIDYFKQNE
jgi:hypothetical protein